jgi:hypothetical protein
MSWRIMMTEEEELVNAILARIPEMAKKGKAPTKTNIHLALRSKYKIKSMRDLGMVLDQMVEFGLLEAPAITGGGRGHKGSGYKVP